MPKRNKDGLFEFNGYTWEYTWVYNGVRKFANWSHNERKLIIAQ